MNGKHSSPQSTESQTRVRSIAFRAAVAQHTAYTIKQASLLGRNKKNKIEEYLR